MTTYYVRTNGNDTTGNGSTGLPWLTITKALTVAVASDTILIGDGTYAENSGGFLNISKNLASTLTLQGENGVSSAVIIVGTSGTNNTLINGTTNNVTFRYLTFGMRAASTYAFRVNAAVSNTLIDQCTFVGVTGTARGLYIGNGSTWNVTGLTLTNCTFTPPGSGTTFHALDMECSSTGTVTGVTLTDCTLIGTGVGVFLLSCGVTLTNCTVTGGIWGVQAATAQASTFTNCTVTGTTGYAYNVNGATSFVINGGTAICNGATNAVLFGVDGSSGNTTTPTVRNLTITRRTDVAGHALIFGAGCLNGLAEYNTIPQSYDHAIVIKENTGCEVRYNTVVGGTQPASSGVYLKAATTASVHHNTVIATVGNGVQVLLNSATTNKCSACVVTDNRIIAAGSANCMNWGDATQDAGGGTCDRNIYDVRGTGSLGTFYGTAVTTLAAARAAWATYGDGSNDARSRTKRRQISAW